MPAVFYKQYHATFTGITLGKLRQTQFSRPFKTSDCIKTDKHHHLTLSVKGQEHSGITLAAVTMLEAYVGIQSLLREIRKWFSL